MSQAPEPFDNCLIVHLRPTAPAFERRSIAYRQEKLALIDGIYSNQGDVSVFYDWLRTKDEVVIGLRVYPRFADAMFFFDVVKDLEYCTRTQEDVGIFFGEAREYDRELSVTQGFGESSAWMRTDGHAWAIAIDNIWMEPSDLDHLSYEYRE